MTLCLSLLSVACNEVSVVLFFLFAVLKNINKYYLKGNYFDGN